MLLQVPPHWSGVDTISLDTTTTSGVLLGWCLLFARV